MNFRKKPVIIQAFRFGFDELPEWIRIDDRAVIEKESCMIKTLEGVMRADLGDWIIKGIKGEIYPCKNDIFVDTYEMVI